MEQSAHKLLLLERIAELERKQLWHLDVEDDPETYPLMPDKVDYLNQKLKNKIMNRIDDIALVTGYSHKNPQSCAPFNDLFALGYQSAAVSYCFGENSDHMPTPDIPDIETRDRMAENGAAIICKMVERMNMPHVVEQLRKLEAYGLKKAAEECAIGEPTLMDIARELSKPGRDPRDELPAPILRKDVLEMKDLKPGMILTGTVRNVIDFGAFVDIIIGINSLLWLSFWKLRKSRA